MMSLAEHCDEILRIIDEALGEGCGKGAPGRGDARRTGLTGNPDSSEWCTASGQDMGAATCTSQTSGSS